MPEVTEEQTGSIVLTTFNNGMKEKGEDLVLKDIYVDASTKEAARPSACKLAKQDLPYPLTASLPPVLRGNSSGQVPVYPPIDIEIEEAALSLETGHPNPGSMILKFSSPRKDIVAGGILFMQVCLLYYDFCSTLA